MLMSGGNIISPTLRLTYGSRRSALGGRGLLQCDTVYMVTH